MRCVVLAALLFASITAAEVLSGYDTTYELVKEGAADAPTVKKGDRVTVHATGTVEQTMKKFWSTKDAGQQPFGYSAGVGGVIKGWDQGCLGMKLGEIRKLKIPAHEGYGANGFPAWGIPPGGTLLFESTPALHFSSNAPCLASL